MTITKNRKDYEIDGAMWFVEQYADKPHFVWFWRYGYVINGRAYIKRDRLFSRPNIRKIINP